MYWNQAATVAKSYAVGWIVTLDVLKLFTDKKSQYAIKLNSNIRCIEI